MPHELIRNIHVTILAQVTAWFRYYLNQCCLKTPTPYGVPRSQEVNKVVFDEFSQYTHVSNLMIKLSLSISQIPWYITHISCATYGFRPIWHQEFTKINADLLSGEPFGKNWKSVKYMQQNNICSQLFSQNIFCKVSAFYFNALNNDGSTNFELIYNMMEGEISP